MKCTKHPEVDAQGMCVYCGKPFCKDCLIEVKGKMYCKDDIGNVIDDAKQTANNSQPTINITNTNTNTNQNTAPMGFAPVGTLRKSKTVALILCLLSFIGLSGLHRMYVGKVGTGVLHFFTGGLCLFGTIYDLIAIFSGGFRDCYGQPLV